MSASGSTRTRRPRHRGAPLSRTVIQEEPIAPCGEDFRLDVEEQRILSEILELASEFGNGVDPFLEDLQKQLKEVRAEKQAWLEWRR